MGRFICIHGHFYQPPRENPWIEEVKVEDSAYPYHDWNERITAECYAPNTASRILDSQKKIIDIVNNYASISFNFGPTLLMWLEQNKPHVYAAILDADKESMKQFSGHGSALAQAYNHIIMPLAGTRDKRTQIIWGIEDFRHRFRRSPEGMWLPETAVDTETLEILADQGILFTILSPSQAFQVKKISDISWTRVSSTTLDCSMPYLCQLRDGKKIVLFFFENNISQEIAFGSLLENGERFADRMMQYFSRTGKDTGLMSVVSDGETYGHHHRFADMALAYALHDIREHSPATITIFAEYLANNPPTHEVEIRENTSWSCPHGIERWRSNCGCCTSGSAVHDNEMHHKRLTPGRGAGREVPETCDIPGNQEWRTPLREAINRLRDQLADIFDTSAGRCFTDPWKARDDYISVILDRSPDSRQKFFLHHALRALTDDEKRDALKLLEMERNAMLMFTSCGWFFDDISGIESVQVMKYACRAMQLAQEISGENPEPEFLNALSRAKSSKPGQSDGATIYLDFVRPSMIDLNRIVFNYALTRLIRDSREHGAIRHYTITDESFEQAHEGELRMVTGKLTLRSEITCKRKDLEYAVLHLGNYDFLGGVREYSGDESFFKTQRRIRTALHESNSPALISLMEQEFGTSTYSLWYLFKDAQRDILSLLLESTLVDLEASFRDVYQQHIALIHAMKEMHVPVPQAIEEPVEYIINRDLNTFLTRDEIDLKAIRHLVGEISRAGFEPDRKTLGYTASKLFTVLTRRMRDVPQDIRAMQEFVDIFSVLSPMSLEYELWECQNDYFHTGKKMAVLMKQASEGEARAVQWLFIFRELGSCLGVRCIG